MGVRVGVAAGHRWARLVVHRQHVLGEVDELDSGVVAPAGQIVHPPGDDLGVPAGAGAADDDGEVWTGAHAWLLRVG